MDWLIFEIMNATVGEIVGVIAGIVAVISVFVEFSSKIKKFPITSMLNWIGERTNKVLVTRMDKLEATVDKISERQDSIEEEGLEREAVNCRVRILRFADEIRRGEKHSYESFEQTLSDMDRYDQFCLTHKSFKNNKTAAAQKLIVTVYDKCLEENDFL